MEKNLVPNILPSQDVLFNRAQKSVPSFILFYPF